MAAARRGDAATVNALVSTGDQEFAARAAVWAGNLQRIAWARLSWTARLTPGAVPESRRARVGDDAWLQRVTVVWGLAGESRTAEEDLWLTFVDEPPGAGGDTVTRLAGQGDGSAAASPVPLWLQQPVRLVRQGPVLVLTGTENPNAWLRQAVAARSAVSARVGPADRDPDDVLVVEVPQSQASFERVLGVRPGSHATVAAAAWPMGPDTSTAALHVIVNPDASARLSVLGRNVLLTHEAVHVATRSPGSPSPTWLVEGYADQIAYQAYPAGSAPAEDTVRTFVRAHGAPHAWPAEEDFEPDANDLELSYDLGWTAVRSIADLYGDDALNRFYAAADGADPGDSVAQAAAVLGTTESALRQHWRRALDAAVEG